MAKTDINRFLSSLWREKLQAQRRRDALIRRKLGWTVGLFALGAINLNQYQVTTYMLLYLIPPMALVFDLYVFGETYGIQRMGAFVRDKHPTMPDGLWELWLLERRESFSLWAQALTTTIVLLIAAALLWTQGESLTIIAAWAILIAATSVFANWKQGKRLNTLKPVPAKPAEAESEA